MRPDSLGECWGWAFSINRNSQAPFPPTIRRPQSAILPHQPEQPSTVSTYDTETTSAVALVTDYDDGTAMPHFSVRGESTDGHQFPDDGTAMPHFGVRGESTDGYGLPDLLYLHALSVVNSM
jgi:hypothetical protein